MKILITGGAGYIGSLLTGYLLEENHKVTVIDNFMYEQNTLASHTSNINLEIINNDIRDYKYLKKILSEFDLIIPLAALVGAPICNYNPIDSQSINYDSNIELFNSISNDQILIMPTTNSAYGHGNDGIIFDETSELNPISNYAIQKVNLEKNLMKTKNWISLRLATVFGSSPRMRLDLLVNNFVWKALKDQYIVLFESSFKRNYIHIRDVCRGILHCINNYDKMKNNIYNLGLDDANLSKKELCDTIKKYINFEYFENDFVKDEDQRNYIVSNKKIIEAGFKTKFSIEDGIKELIKTYKGINIKNYKNF